EQAHRQLGEDAQRTDLVRHLSELGEDPRFHHGPIPINTARKRPCGQSRSTPCSSGSENLDMMATRACSNEDTGGLGAVVGSVRKKGKLQ
ncbi:MAG: hypothetical protein WBN62_11015, partial [Thermoanaerobaculia bacterium]